MFKLIVLICVVFCLQDIIAAPERPKEGLHEEQSFNATVEVVEAAPERHQEGLNEEQSSNATVEVVEAAPERHQEGLNEEQSPNATVEVVEAAPERHQEGLNEEQSPNATVEVVEAVPERHQEGLNEEQSSNATVKVVEAAPERLKEGLHEKQSSNATVEVVEDNKVSELFNEILLMSNEMKAFEVLSTQADTIGCFTQNMQTEVVNFMRDLSNFNIRVFDDTTNNMINRWNSFVDRINSENVFFLSVITACTSIPGSSLESCIKEAIIDQKPKIAILIQDQFNLNTEAYKEDKLQWALNSFELMGIYSNFFTAIQGKDYNC